MNLLIQRVNRASISIQGKKEASISKGLLVMIGFNNYDNQLTVNKAAKKIISYCIFSDSNRRINKTVQEVEGDILLIPQITLAIDTSVGNKPNFSDVGSPKKAQQNFDSLKKRILSIHGSVDSGVFGSDMQIDSVNDGPVTFFFKIN